MFEKHLWKSDILSKDAGRLQVFFKHFTSKNQLPGLSIIGTLVESGLMKISIFNSSVNTQQFLRLSYLNNSCTQN